MRDKALSYLIAKFNRLIDFLNAIGTVWVAGMMVLICGDIFGRALFNSPIIGVPEIVRVSVVGIVWLQMAYTLKIGAHLRSNIILDRLSVRWQHIVEVIGCILGVLVFSLAAYTSWDVMIEGWRIKEFEGELPVRVPVYPIRTIVLIGTFLTMTQFFIILCQNVYALFHPGQQEEK